MDKNYKTGLIFCFEVREEDFQILWGRWRSLVREGGHIALVLCHIVLLSIHALLDNQRNYKGQS